MLPASRLPAVGLAPDASAGDGTIGETNTSSLAGAVLAALRWHASSPSGRSTASRSITTRHKRCCWTPGCQVGEQTQSLWNPATYLDPAYWTELNRRKAIKGSGIDLEQQHRREQSVVWPAPPGGGC